MTKYAVVLLAVFAVACGDDEDPIAKDPGTVGSTSGTCSAAEAEYTKCVGDVVYECNAELWVNSTDCLDTDKVCTDNECLSKAFRTRLLCVFKTNAPLASVTEKPAKKRQVLWR